MTGILGGIARSLLGTASLHQMTDDADREWDHQPFGQMPTLPNQWSDQQGSRMGGMQDVDLSVFQHDPYPATYGTTATQMLPTGYGYYAGLDLPACSDVEMHTPTTANFPLVAPTEVSFTTISASYLQPPTTAHASLAARSPKSVHSNLSPRPRLRYPNGQHAPPPTTTSHHQQHRPAISRAATAPEPRDPPALKRNASTISDADPEDEDEEYVPVAETKSSRGGGAHRKRQRIPHTAVERRYRDNLNAHLDKLRLSVPAFTGGAREMPGGSLGSAAGSTAGGKSGGVGSGEAKPSKCEVLNGAIEHIGEVERENRGLREEVQMLGARVEELERWCREGGRGGGRGGGFGGS
ncbi:hypothetical protein LTR91_025758 [Friedmanniomyces endolithicus]|uniref:BHLH domain-containing protein n=1 Tax=Friedmanniomyces endolithicus TaxID=329885 RepID=A0AAN6JW99_9PEZI|nr:hypothetical protein LTR91_025758 [Friedmanniomyces endolithicus]KAK0950874.1 hypothetical protein LTS01_025456 [Friedmanniomyces endolithicus]KAK1021771.1 hypothetical protein LTS16_026256 [Friedmanniomyces endolithicus]